MSAPWMKFYPSDWRSDPKLRMCSIGARGLWVEMLCVMHEAEPYGYLTSNGNAVTSRQMAALAGISAVECMKFLLELVSAGVYSIDENKMIFSRRMVRDKAKAERDRENGKGGGNPNLPKGVNPPVKGEDKAQKPEATTKTISKQQASAPPRSDLENSEAKTSQSDLAVRVLKTDLMEAFGEKRCPDLTRASDWIAKGYAPSMCTDVVIELLARKPDISSLAYFDKVLAERHATRGPTPSERAAGLPPKDMDWAIKHFVKGGQWSRQAGPEPGQPGCRATPEMLAAHGIGPDGQKLRVDA